VRIYLPRKKREVEIPDGLTPEQIAGMIDESYDAIPEMEVAPAVSTAVAEEEFEGIRPERLPVYPWGEGPPEEIPSISEVEQPSISQRAYEWGREKMVGPRELYFPEAKPTAISEAEEERLRLRGEMTGPTLPELGKGLVETALVPAVAAGAIAAPIPTLIGVGTFMGISELMNLGAAGVREDIDYKFGAGKGLPEVLGVKGGAVKTGAEVAEFIGKVVTAGKVAGAGKFLVKAPWFKSLTDKEKGFLTLDVWKRIQRGETKAQVSKDIPKIMRSKEGRAKYFREQAARTEVEGGTLGMTLFPFGAGKRPPKWSVSSDAARGAINTGDLNIKGFARFAKKRGIEIKALADADAHIPLVQEYMSKNPRATKGTPWPGMPKATGMPQTPEGKLLEFVKKTKVSKKELDDLTHKELQRKALQIDTIWGAGTGEAGYREALRSTTGQKLPQVEIDPLLLPRSQIDYLFNRIHAAPLSIFNRVHAGRALSNLTNGVVPRGNDMKSIAKVFGPEIEFALEAKRPAGVKIYGALLEAANTPRTTLTAEDLSGAGRQGLILGLMKPKIAKEAFITQLKAFANEEYFKAQDMLLRVGPRAKRRAEAGVFKSEFWDTADIGMREEAIQGRLAQFIPGVRASARAYAIYLDKLRADYFDYITGQEWDGSIWFEALSPLEKLAQEKSLAHMINVFSGRGSLGALKALGPALNAAFFSPRYTSSRFEMPLLLFTSTPEVRKIVAGGLVRYVGTGLAIMGLAKLGGAEVEHNPLSTDFGKIKIGNTRYNYWGADQSMARMVAQMVMGKGKATATGHIYTKRRAKTLTDFLRTKLSPLGGGVTDIIAEETMIREEFTPRSIRESFTLPKGLRMDWESVKKVAEVAFDNVLWKRMGPMTFQDIVEVIRFQRLEGGHIFKSKVGDPIAIGVAATAMSIPSVLGIGQQTYPPSPWADVANKKDELANDYYGVAWDELSPKEQELVRGMHGEIGKLEGIARAERRGIPDLRPMFREQRGAERNVRDMLSEENKAVLEHFGITVKGLSRRIGTWVLNDERYDRYQKLSALYVGEEIEKEVGRRLWPTYDDERVIEGLEKAVDKGKGKARKQLKKEAEEER